MNVPFPPIMLILSWRCSAHMLGRTAAKQPVKIVELWQRLDQLVHQSGHRIAWHWVKGHAGNPGNERADALANLGVEKALAGRSSAG